MDFALRKCPYSGSYAISCVRTLCASVSCGSGGGAFFGVALATAVGVLIDDVSAVGGCPVWCVNVVLVGCSCC